MSSGLPRVRKWLDLARIFAPPEHAVESLAVQAQMVEPVETQSRFELLVRHFLDSFLNNEMVSDDGEAKSHLLQVGYAIALPQLVVALFLFVPYHSPHVRAYWAQVSDRYFYVLYSMVAIGTFTVFEWELFFPSIVDVLVLSSLPIEPRKLFQARTAAIAIFLSTLVVGINLLGTIFFPATCDLPSLIRHFSGHFLAVTASGAFAAAFILASQGMLLAALGPGLFGKISPLLQGLFVTVLLLALFLFPIVSRFLDALVTSHSAAARWFPPFWFLGLYERILGGPAALPVFAAAMRTGLLATVCAVVLAAAFYPLAYGRVTRQLIEGRPARSCRNWAERPINWMLHILVVRLPVRRAIYHFIGLTLLRTQRHRVYLAMYGGAGLALAISSAVLLKLGGHGRVGILFSADGLRAAVPIAAFWTIAGLRNAFVSPVDRRGSWIFRVIRGRPGLDLLSPARAGVLLWASAIVLAMVALVHAIAPPSLRGRGATAVQVIVAVALCLLLRDIFLLRMKTIPFTGRLPGSRMNLAFVLIQYFGLFPPMILLTLGVESWMEVSVIHTVAALLAVIALHLALSRAQRRMATEHADLLDIDEDEEEFPQRLGLRY